MSIRNEDHSSVPCAFEDDCWYVTLKHISSSFPLMRISRHRLPITTTWNKLIASSVLMALITIGNTKNEVNRALKV